LNGAHPLLEELRARCAEIADLEKVSYLLDWDEETQMPRAGGEERLRQKAALQRVLSERWTSDRLAELVEALAPVEAQLDPHSDEAALIRVVRADVARARCVPVVSPPRAARR
jgi:carboxypeptidase Taq